MPGQGRVPKNPDERARTNTPMRGEWRILPPLERTILPALPKGTWSAHTKRTWALWRKSWVTGAFTDAEVAMTVQLAYLYERMVQSNFEPPRCAEVRQWMDRLGLTMKGQADLRLRLADVEIESVGKRPEARRRYGALEVLPGGASVAGA